MPETEKITINIGAVDLGKIDLLVQEGLYTNRTDFIRTAIRSQIEKHHLEVEQSVARDAFVIGVLRFGRAYFERTKREGKRLKLRVIGMLSLAPDISPNLASEVIESVWVRGMFKASDSVKAALADRME